VNARKKLNRAFFLGSLLLASLLGAVTGSWLVFSMALALLVTTNVYVGEIR